MLTAAPTAMHDSDSTDSTSSFMTDAIPPPPQQWGQELALVALKRDKSAYSALFNFFAPRLRAFGMRMFGNEQQALEMVQDTMLNVWQKAHLYDPSRGCASTWIFTIARNVRFDMLRKKMSRKDDILADDLWADGDYPDMEDEQSERWDIWIVAEKIAPHFESLPPAQRLVMEKVYLDECTHQQVADELGLPLGTVKSRIRLALERLREALDATHS